MRSLRDNVYRTLTLLAVAASLSLMAHAQFIEPTAEELKMTAQPEVPGAAAVYLNREETTEDALHMYSVYARIKVLSDAGKKYADVELTSYRGSEGRGYTITDIQGRTIHPDGTIIPFTGKPYEKLVARHDDERVTSKVFTLPDVQVGSIVEYRYKMRYDDNYFIPPRWVAQGDLFVRKAYYMWKPTDEQLIGADGRLTNTISYSTLLPKGAEIKKSELPDQNTGHIHRKFELRMENIPPMPQESFMPPIEDLSYRVWFYYTAFYTKEEFWKATSKQWSKEEDKFIDASSLTDAVNKIITPGEPQEQTLHKIYAAVMEIENTDFTRSHTSSEDKAVTGHAAAHSAADIWQLKRGSGDQIAELFVGFARAAHIKAYMAQVSDRSRGFFLPEYMSDSQLPDKIAIVAVDGKEEFFDPGQRYCPYGQLAWQHTYVGGMRQTDSGPAMLQATPAAGYKDSVTQRVADLVMDKDGSVSGPVSIIFTGAPALQWRQRALRTDDEGIHQRFKQALEALLPPGVQVEVKSIDKLTDYNDKLAVRYEIKGNLGSITGKRIILPVDLFEAATKEAFPQQKRVLPVYFDYSFDKQDVTRIRFPAGFKVESAPPASQDMYLKSALNSLNVQSAPNSIIIRRNEVMADVSVPAAEYPQLKAYYSKMEQRAQESLVVSTAAVSGAN
jgi:hypothetical protein